MPSPFSDPKGECVHCEATAKYVRGEPGEAGTFTWSNGGTESWPTGSNASRCVKCHERLGAEAKQRQTDFVAAQRKLSLKRRSAR